MRITLIIISIFTLFLSILGFSREYPFAIALQENNAGFAKSLETLDMENPPPSVRSQRELMTFCAKILPKRPIPLDFERVILQNCQQLSDSILAKSPSSARGNFLKVASKDQAHLKVDEYRKARLAAPYEPWPLSSRLLLIDRLSLQSLTNHLEEEVLIDLSSAMQTPWGRDFLARLWKRNPKLQPLIMKAALSRPNDEQRDFLNKTKRAANNG